MTVAGRRKSTCAYLQGRGREQSPYHILRSTSSKNRKDFGVERVVRYELGETSLGGFMNGLCARLHSELCAESREEPMQDTPGHKE